MTRLLIGCSGGPYGQPQQYPDPIVTVQVQPQQPPVFPTQPVQTTCPNCHQVVITVTEPMMGLLAWLAVGGLIFIGSVTSGSAERGESVISHFTHVRPFRSI